MSEVGLCTPYGALFEWEPLKDSVEAGMTNITARTQFFAESLPEGHPLRGKLANLLKEARIQDDLFARATVLEGALNMRPGSLSKRPVATLPDIQQNFPDINPQFFDMRRDYDLYGAVIGGAGQIKGTSYTSDEIAQALIAGLTIVNMDEVSGGSIYRRLGKKLANALKAGRVDMKGLAGTLRSWAKARAMDVIDSRRDVSIDEGFGDEGFDQASMIDRFYSDPGTSETALSISVVNKPGMLQTIDRAVRKELRGPGQEAVWDAVLNDPGLLNPSARGMGIDQQPLAEAISQMTGTEISRQVAGRTFRDKVLPAMERALANDEKLQQTLMKDRDIQQVFQDAMRLAAGYARKSMRGGDYGGAASSKQLVKDMIANMRRVKTPAERSHAVEQVQHAEAARSITPQQAKEVMSAINKASRTAEWKGWTEDMPVQVVTMKGTEVFPNLAAAQKKYRDLDPRRNGRKFTWAMKDRVKGRPAIRFEAWDVNRMLSMSASSKSGKALAGPWYATTSDRAGVTRFFLGKNKAAATRWLRGISRSSDEETQVSALFQPGASVDLAFASRSKGLDRKDKQLLFLARSVYDNWEVALRDFQQQGTTRSEDADFMADYAKNLRMASLRERAIRLASENPELRAALLPLLKEQRLYASDVQRAIKQVVGKLVNDRTIKKYLRFSKDLEGGKVKKIRLDDGLRVLVITIAEQYPGITFHVIMQGNQRDRLLVGGRGGVRAHESISKVFSPIMKAVKEWVEEGKGDLLKAASEQEAEKLQAEAEANEQQAEADEAKAEAARVKEAGRTPSGETIFSEREPLEKAMKELVEMDLVYLADPRKRMRARDIEKDLQELLATHYAEESVSSYSGMGRSRDPGGDVFNPKDILLDVKWIPDIADGIPGWEVAFDDRFDPRDVRLAKTAAAKLKQAPEDTDFDIQF